MKTNIPATDPANKVENPNEVMKNENNDLSIKKRIRMKRKHHSAALAETEAKSAVSQADSTSYRDSDFMHTGTNLSYREEE